MQLRHSLRNMVHRFRVASASTSLLPVLVFWIASAAFVARYESSVFRGYPLQLSQFQLDTFDAAVVNWSLLSRTMLILVPCVVMHAIVLARQGNRRWRGATWVCHFSLLVWLMINAKLMQITGADLSYYFSRGGNLENWEWIGNLSAIATPIASDVFGLMLGLAGIFFLIHASRLPGWGRKNATVYIRVVTGTIVTLLLLTLGVFPARVRVSQPLALERLYSSMTLRGGLFDPEDLPRHCSPAFGGTCDNQFLAIGERLTQLSEFTPVGPIPAALQPVQRPHIVVVITESLQYNSLERADRMPRLGTLAKKGLTSRQHYCNSNCSHLGSFSLLYGQLPISFDTTLDQRAEPAANRLLKSLGYHSNLIASCAFGYCRMDEFMNCSTFDYVSMRDEKSMPWYTRDEQALKEVAQILRDASEPQFITVYLLATHYGYQYPPEYDTNPPAGISAAPVSQAARDVLNNRYAKAAAFLDREFEKLIGNLDMSNTILVVTGDHGESIYDDGYLAHGTKLSRYQSGTPLVMLGPGIPPTEANRPTGHVDVLPTLLHAIYGEDVQCDGLHGHSLLSEDAPASQFLVQAQPSFWEIMYVHPSGRLVLSIPRSHGETRLVGFHNQDGMLDLTHQSFPADAQEWNARLRSHSFGTPRRVETRTAEGTPQFRVR